MRPAIHTKEILFTDSLLAEQDEGIGMLIKSKEEKACRPKSHCRYAGMVGKEVYSANGARRRRSR